MPTDLHALAERLEQAIAKAVSFDGKHFIFSTKAVDELKAVARLAAAYLREARPGVEAIFAELKAKQIDLPEDAARVLRENLWKLYGEATAPTPAVQGQANSDYELGRAAVRRELTEAVQRFNDDDSMGIGQLIEVISPWLDDESQPPRAPERPTLDRKHWDALRTYVEHFGALHDEGCPEDDTCSCSCAPVNAAVNELCALPAPPSSRPAPQEK